MTRWFVIPAKAGIQTGSVPGTNTDWIAFGELAFPAFAGMTGGARLAS